MIGWSDQLDQKRAKNAFFVRGDLKVPPYGRVNKNENGSNKVVALKDHSPVDFLFEYFIINHNHVNYFTKSCL